MSFKLFRPFWLILALALAAVLSSCSGKDESQKLEEAIVIARENIASITVGSTSGKTLFEPGEQWQLTAQAVRDDGSTFDVSSRVAWRSAESAVGAVNGKGVFTAAQIKGVLPVDVTAKLAQFSASIELNVSDAALVSIATTLAGDGPVNECLGSSAAASGTYSDGSVRPLTDIAWSSSDAGVARVDAQGNISTLAAGLTDIIGSRGGVNSAPAPLTVSDTLSGIAVSGAGGNTGTVEIGVGDAADLVATGLFSNGTPQQPIGQSTSWSSLDTGIVKVDASGRASALAAGSSQITASCGGLDGTISVNVVGISGVIIVNPQKDALVPGDRIEMELYGLLSGNKRGNVDLADKDDDRIVWSIEPNEGDTIATIDEEGILEINQLSNITRITRVRVNAQYAQTSGTFNATLLVQVKPN